MSKKLSKKVRIKVLVLAFIMLAFTLSFTANLFAYANNRGIQVVDKAHLFNASQISELEDAADEIRKAQDFDMFINLYTVDDTNGLETREYGDNLYDMLNDGYNGFYILIDLDNRNYYVGTFGDFIDIFTDQRIEYILDAMEDDMKNEDYFAAFQDGLKEANKFIDLGIPVGQHRLSEAEIRLEKIKRLLINMGVALTIAVIVAYKKYKSVLAEYDKYQEKPLYDYRTNAIVDYQNFNDIVSNHYVYTTPLPKNTEPNYSSSSSSTRSTTHTTSSGHTSGGGGRGF